MKKAPRIPVVSLSILATSTIITEATAFVLGVWHRALRPEANAFGIIGIACAIAFLAVLFYCQYWSRRS